MNILIVHNYYQLPGGEDMVVENEKKLLMSHGHNVTVYTRNNSELKDMGKISKLFMAFGMIFSARTYREVKKIIKQEHIDIVNVHNTLSLISPSVYYAARARKKPVFQTIHNFRLMCPGATFYRNAHICEDCVTKGLTCGIKHACYRQSRFQTFASACILWFHRFTGIYRKINYICLTEFNKQKLLQGIKGLKENQVFVKPNFTGTDIDCNQVADSDNNRDYYLYAARLEKIKGTDILLKAWKEISESHDYKLVVCGIGDLENKCKAYVKKHNLENVQFLGQVPNDELKKLMDHAKAVILPSQWYEGFPVTIAESFSRGTPVITGDMGNAGDLVESGKTGLKYCYDSYMELAKTVEFMENLDREAYGRMVKNCREVYENCYSEEINYRILSEIYKIKN